MVIVPPKVDVKKLVGRNPDDLSLKEQIEAAGLTVALEIYSPATLPERRIAAIGDSAEACIEQLAAAGKDPRKFEYVVLKVPF